MKWEKKSLAFMRLILEPGDSEDTVLRAIAQASWELAAPFNEAIEPLAPDWKTAIRSKRIKILQKGAVALDMDNVAGKLCNTLILRTKSGLDLQLPWFEQQRGPIETVLNKAVEILKNGA